MIGITGATGFVGRELIAQLADSKMSMRCWHRKQSELGFAERYSGEIEWIEGELGDLNSTREFVAGCRTIVHAALWKPGNSFRGGEGDVVQFARVNILGTLELIEAAISAGVEKFIFVSTCAVHEKILDDRPLDETHPLWPMTHYGAHKAAIEKFVHSYGYGKGFPICAIRPTGIYGIQQPVTDSKWYSLVRKVVAGETVEVRGGGKEVHVSDVAKAIQVLIDTDSIVGESYACYDRYVSQYEVAEIAKQLSGSDCQIVGASTLPKHEIVSDKIRGLGMKFGGTALLRTTIEKLVSSA
jgi:nucleoside-diphosphate-sugar epimerase